MCNFTTYLIDNQYTKYTIVNLSVLATTVLNYYLNLKIVYNISYDGTSSTDVVYHKCNISVNTKIKALHIHSV